jgi:tetratricopeptide (TPR) repeat protein
LTDRNLLLGVLALQMDFVTRDDLIRAMHSWVLDKQRSLGEILQEQGALTAERRRLLDLMEAEHLKAHGGDAGRSLAAVAHPSTLDNVLDSVDDAAVQASLAAAGGTFATTAEPRPSAGLRYQVLRPHARGGLGIVSVARDAELGREVALKEIEPGAAGDAASRGRFVREAEITGGLEHPGIVPVYGLGTYTDGRPYYAMRFVRGETLQEALRKLHEGEAGYTLRGLLTRFVAVCNAVAYAHSRGVIHRDLKPANVMLGPYGETLVVDWGLAKVIGRESVVEDRPAEATLRPPSSGSSLTQAGAALGTPAFMSPEQAHGEVNTLGPATDVYSLGATLYAVVTGEAPVRGRDTAEILEKVRRGEWAPPRQVKPSTPRALDAICRKAMALKPADRYASVLELAAEVEHWLADEPVPSYREPWPVRAGRWARRHRTPVTGVAAAALVAIALGSAAALWWQQEQARRLHGAEAALERVDELQTKGQWAEARAALDQAEDRLGGAGPAELRRRLEEARRTLELVARLDSIRMDRLSLSPEGNASLNPTAGRYEAAFAEAGLGGPSDDAAQVAERVAGSPAREPLLAALDDWAGGAPASKREWLLEVARRVDPDPWRDRLRDPKAWKDLRVLAELQRQVPPEAVRPSLVAAMSERLRSAGGGEDLLRAAWALRPDDLSLNVSLSHLLFEKQQFAEAEGYMRVVVAQRPASAKPRQNIGSALQRQHKTDEAIKYFRKAIELDPNSAQTLTNLGISLDERGNRGEATDCFRKAVALDPRWAAAQMNLGRMLRIQGQREEGLSLLRRATELDPRDAWAWANLGNALHEEGQSKEAEADLRKAVALDPRCTLAFANLGRMLHARGRWEEGLSLLRRATELDAGNAVFLAWLGFALHEEGNSKEAEAVLRKAVALDPRNSQPAATLGHVLSDQTRLPEAAEWLNKALTLEPKDAYARRILGILLDRQGKTAEGVAQCREAIALDPLVADSHASLGNIFWRHGELVQAERYYRKAIELRPDRSIGYTNLAGVLGQQGRVVEAVALLRKSVELNPKKVETYVNLADCLMRQGKATEAESVCRKAIELAPKTVEAHGNLAEALLGQGRYKEAQESALQSIKLMAANDPNRAEGEAAVRQAKAGERLEAVLRGDQHPGSAAEAIDFAGLCHYQWRLAETARLYADAFAAEPRLADNLAAGYRYNAACNAAPAGCGEGKGAPGPDDKERPRLRQQALTWLRADLAVRTRQLAGPPRQKAGAAMQLRMWLAADDLAGVRDAAKLTQLPEVERKEWEAFWEEVRTLLGKATGAG